MTVRQLALAALALALCAAGPATAQAQAQRPIKLGIYTPTVEFADSGARLSYVQALAAAVERAVKRDVEGLSFTSLRSLRAAAVDVAVVDAACAASRRWKVLASGRVGDGDSRSWALFARAAADVDGLRGKRLVLVASGCGDRAFVANALLGGDLSLAFFGATTSKPDLKGAVAEVATVRGADAVFAPVGAGHGLRRLAVVGSAPGPALVQVNGRLEAGVAAAVTRAVAGFGGRGPIAGFTAGGAARYEALRRRMAGAKRRGVFAQTPPIKLEAAAIIAERAAPASTVLAPLAPLFGSPPARQ